MNPALRKLVRKGAPGAAEVDNFVSNATFPLVDGTDVTFVYRGIGDAVYLRCWIAGLNTAQPLQRLEGTDLWAITIELPEKSRIEYKFEVVNGDQRELVLDPLNDVLAHDPFGANSVCQGYRYKRPVWTEQDDETRAGSLERIEVESKAFRERRDIQVYLPARFRKNRRYPLVVVHDGPDYLRFAALKTVLDNLIHRLEIPQMIVAMTQSPDRLTEYAGNDAHAKYLVNDVVPLMADKYPLIDEPHARGLMGASFGGVAALHAAWLHPGVFGRLLLQSGSFAFSDLGAHQRGPVFDPVVRFMNEFRKNPGLQAEKIYMCCGIYESLIYENRSLVPQLQAQGINIKFEEARDAHNWENWRDRLRNGLSWLFPGPVWMVYE
ncbi:MAG: alpha/beta hydrolase-fold protein [Gammaproteobacteria bacterium]|nr:alpha/beta hydrolase-fold protein [Gammaproteobacteria bacterium]